MSRGPLTWALVDGRAGTGGQALGVAEALGRPYEARDLAYNGLAALPNIVLGRTLAHLGRESAAAIGPPWPDLVIAAGRRAAPVARAVKRLGGGAPFLVQIMWPGPPARDIDLVAVPAHDLRPAAPNVVATVGAPHRVTAAALERGRRAWAGRLGRLARPRIAVLVGGPPRGGRSAAAAARALCRAAAALADDAGGSLMVATSPRTDAGAEAELRAGLGPGAELHLWRPDGGNPYLGYLAWSDAVVVTGDSASMCTEACATGRPVYIFAPEGLGGPRHRRLHSELFGRGIARPLGPGGGGWRTWRYDPLDDAATVAAEIGRRAPGLGAPGPGAPGPGGGGDGGGP